MNPWSCLRGDSNEKTTVLYFDSLCQRPPLASSGLFARIVIELNAIRANIPADKPVDVGFVEEVKDRIAFVKVKASYILNAPASGADVNTSALQVQQQKAGSVDCGFHVIHNLRVLFEKWTVNIAGIVRAFACKACANANSPCFFVESLQDVVTTCSTMSWTSTRSGTRWGSGCC